MGRSIATTRRTRRPPKGSQDSKDSKKRDQHHHDKRDKDDELEQDINRKMNKTAQITLWVDPSENRIVKYTFDNVWMDFLPAAWLVRIDDIRASMEMGQPFEGVWLPRTSCRPWRRHARERLARDRVSPRVLELPQGGRHDAGSRFPKQGIK